MNTPSALFVVSFACIAALTHVVHADPSSTPSSVDLRPARVQHYAPPDEPQTLLSEPIRHGAYGGPLVSYTRFANSDSVLVGGRGGWIINHQIVLGGGGFGIASQVHPPLATVSNHTDYRLNLGYGGAWFEYLIAPFQVVHGSLGFLIGGGGLSYTRFRPAGAEDTKSDSVFVIDPVAAIELNATRFMHVAIQAGYRFVSGVELKGLRNGDVSGFNFGAIAKFGVF
jgi:hypothetical protein